MANITEVVAKEEKARKEAEARKKAQEGKDKPQDVKDTTKTPHDPPVLPAGAGKVVEEAMQELGKAQALLDQQKAIQKVEYPPHPGGYSPEQVAEMQRKAEQYDSLLQSLKETDSQLPVDRPKSDIIVSDDWRKAIGSALSLDLRPPQEIPITPDLGQAGDWLDNFKRAEEACEQLSFAATAYGGLYRWYRGQALEKIWNMLAPKHQWLDWLKENKITETDARRCRRLFQECKNKDELWGLSASKAQSKFVTVKKTVSKGKGKEEGTATQEASAPPAKPAPGASTPATTLPTPATTAPGASTPAAKKAPRVANPDDLMQQGLPQDDVGNVLAYAASKVKQAYNGAWPDKAGLARVKKIAQVAQDWLDTLTSYIEDLEAE